MRTLAIWLALVGTARADDSWRCSDRIVAVGESAREVLEKCGAPSVTRRRTDRRRGRGGIWVNQVVDTWTYDRGASEFVRVLWLYDGILREIEVGDYGR